MASSAFPKRTFQKTISLCIAILFIVIALASFPRPVSGAPDCPTTPIKGSVSLFMKGSYLDVQFGKNPDLQKNAILKDIIAKTILKPLKIEGFPYSGPNSSNWLFVFDLGCNPPAPLTLTLANKEGKKIEVTLKLFEGTRYVGILHGMKSATLADLFAKGTLSEVTLNLVGGGNTALWQSGPLKVYRTRSGGSDRNGKDGGMDGGGSGGGSGGGGDGGGGGNKPPIGPH